MRAPFGVAVGHRREGDLADEMMTPTSFHWVQASRNPFPGVGVCRGQTQTRARGACEEVLQPGWVTCGVAVRRRASPAWRRSCSAGRGRSRSRVCGTNQGRGGARVGRSGVTVGHGKDCKARRASRGQACATRGGCACVAVGCRELSSWGRLQLPYQFARGSLHRLGRALANAGQGEGRRSALPRSFHRRVSP